MQIRGIHLGASGGPMSLLLLPKCPLCLMPLLAFLGVAVVPSAAMLNALAGVVIVAWASFIIVLARRQPLIRAVALMLAIVGAAAIFAESRVALWSAAVAMTAVGFWLARACATKCAKSGQLDTPTSPA